MDIMHSLDIYYKVTRAGTPKTPTQYMNQLAFVKYYISLLIG